MQPLLEVYLDGNETPVTAQIQSLGFWIYDELRERAHQQSSEHGLRLTLAYLEITNKEPDTLAEVKTWAREHRVTVIMVDPPDPTQSDRTVETS
jgi:hypothetical protein